jgi:hypothetical protein
LVQISDIHILISRPHSIPAGSAPAEALGTAQVVYDAYTGHYLGAQDFGRPVK